jgi:hypothetical protein
MNTHSAREYISFASAQLLRTWRERRPSSQCDRDASVTGDAEGIFLYWDGHTSNLTFVQNTIVVGLRFNDISYIIGVII